jgi:tetrahydromethanopterin S-methyltransferase subunit B
MTASLGNFIYSLFAGSIVVSLIAFALVIISRNDRVTRNF